MGLMLLGGMAVYRDLDLSIYRDLPEGVRELFGIGDLASVGQLAYGAIYGFMAALALSGVAISIGASLIAGEEKEGTMGMLLGNPESRSRILSQKTAALLVLVFAGALVLWAAALISPELLGVSTSGIDIGALMIHMLAISLFFGLLALARRFLDGKPGSRIRNLGRRSDRLLLCGRDSASGRAGRPGPDLPVVLLRRQRPAQQRDRRRPPRGALRGVGPAVRPWLWSGFRSRDLRERTIGVSLFDRLRELPVTHAVIERLEGSARVSGIVVKTVSARTRGCWWSPG